MTLCRIALGGNLGEVPATFAAALARLAGPDLRVAAVSRLYSTPPMGVDAGGAFVNAAASIETSLDPFALLDRLLATEDALGRVRTVRWGPRPIDLDLIFFGDEVIDAPRLRVPHPAAWYRRFVLDPLCDVAADAFHPEAGETVAALRGRLAVRPLPVAVVGPSAESAAVIDALRGASSEIEFVRATEPAAFTVRIGAEHGSVAERTIDVPADGREVETAHAIVAAALGVPEPAGSVAYPTNGLR